MADLRRHGIEAAGLATKGGAEVDHRDRPRGLLDAPDRHGLEDIHRALSTVRFRSSVLPLRWPRQPQQIRHPATRRTGNRRGRQERWLPNWRRHSLYGVYFRSIWMFSFVPLLAT